MNVFISLDSLLWMDIHESIKTKPKTWVELCRVIDMI
jgi:hypothetical protein